MNGAMMTLLSLSISGSILALVLFAMLPLLKNKLPRSFQYYIWLLVLLRLAVPLSFDNSMMHQVFSEPAQTQVVSGAADSPASGIQADPAAQSAGVNSPEKISTSGTAAAPTTRAAGNAASPAASEALTLASERLNSIVNTALRNLPWEAVAGIWLLGAAIYGGRRGIAYFRFCRKITKACVRPHPMDMAVFSQLRGDANIRLVCSRYFDTPILIGIFSPCIVIPQRAFVALGMESELRHILRHEMMHYRRRDLLYKWFVVFVSALHWFNPLMIPIRRKISRACELSCDEAVLRSLDSRERRAYGETLLSIASDRRLPSGAIATTMCEDKRELKERLLNIMKYKKAGLTAVVFSLILTLALTGCGMALGAATTESTIPKTTSSTVAGTSSDNTTSGAADATIPSGTSAAGTIETTAASLSSASAAYLAVLENKAEFTSLENNRQLYLNDFLTNKELYGTAFDIMQFAVLDLDGNGTTEVVLELTVGGDPQFFEILYEENGEIFGSLISYRGLQALKADGTFYYSNGAADYGWSRMTLSPEGPETASYGYSESDQSGSTPVISCFIEDKPVTQQELDAFMDEQAAKTDAAWTAFSAENAEAALG